MKLYDSSYNETFSQIVKDNSDREKAKKLMGQIYGETLNSLNGRHKTIKEIKGIFENIKRKHGISFA